MSEVLPTLDLPPALAEQLLEQCAHVSNQIRACFLTWRRWNLQRPAIAAVRVARTELTGALSRADLLEQDMDDMHAKMSTLRQLLSQLHHARDSDAAISMLRVLRFHLWGERFDVLARAILRDWREQLARDTIQAERTAKNLETANLTKATAKLAASEGQLGEWAEKLEGTQEEHAAQVGRLEAELEAVKTGGSRDQSMLTDAQRKVTELEADVAVRARQVAQKLAALELSLIHISEPTRLLSISYAVFCLKKKNKKLQE
eukprot:TRINITY_DN55622_c0_g1_i1.p1 TRINITY_DN55622_c0_g1~~TRINITY_DN55622_c0_g1_i1.p1  ORF type:complete len:260 (-),score=64.04 TRINITY_DN55622_c0_g1_i1:82-861(-)